MRNDLHRHPLRPFHCELFQFGPGRDYPHKLRARRVLVEALVWATDKAQAHAIWQACTRHRSPHLHSLVRPHLPTDLPPPAVLRAGHRIIHASHP